MTQTFHTSSLDEQELEKLSELRAKTDQQLQGLVHSKLEVGLSFAAVAEVEAAREALAEAQRLLPALNKEHRRTLDAKLTELQEALDRLGRRRASGLSPAAWGAAM